MAISVDPPRLTTVHGMGLTDPDYVAGTDAVGKLHDAGR
jgi:hypothetical protein